MKQRVNLSENVEYKAKPPHDSLGMVARNTQADMILPTWNGVKFATRVLRQRVRREPVRRKLVLSGIISTYFPASAIVFVFFNRISIIVHVNHNVTMIVGELNYECAATRSPAACPRKHVFAFLISLVWARFGKTNAIVKIGGSRGRKSCGQFMTKLRKRQIPRFWSCSTPPKSRIRL